MRLAIINYGMGNLRSVANAFHVLGVEANIAEEPGILKECDRIVLPGVGSFGEAMKNLHLGGWIQALEEQVLSKGKPFLGICLGMQLVATIGTEHGLNKGLDWIPGEVRCLESDKPEFRLPHIGWNSVNFIKKSCLYSGLGDLKDFYFVNSYAFSPDDPDVISGTCEYFTKFAASIEKDNIFATQYHPEKSHKAGLAVLKNFLEVKVS